LERHLRGYGNVDWLRMWTESPAVASFMEWEDPNWGFLFLGLGVDISAWGGREGAGSPVVVFGMSWSFISFAYTKKLFQAFPFLPRR